MNELSNTVHGRLLSIAILVALGGGGLGSLDKSATGVAIMCSSLIVGLALAFIAVAWAIRVNTKFAFAGVVALPFLFFALVVGLAVARHAHAVWASYAFTALGVAFGLNVLIDAFVIGPIHRQPHAHAH